MSEKRIIRQVYFKFKHIYQFYHYLKEKTKVVDIAYLFVSLVLGAMIHSRFKKLEVTMAISFVVSIIYFLFARLVRYLVVNYVRNTGSKNLFILPGTSLVKDVSRKVITINIDNVNRENYYFADITSAYAAAELNFKCYVNGPWETHGEDKYKRNLSHIMKNENSFMFVKEPEDKKPKSYTHILPVSKNVWDQYLNSQYKDNEFYGDLVTANQGFSEFDKPFGLILFSVGSLKYQKFYHRRKTHYRKLLGNTLEKAIAFHLKTHLDTLFQKGEYVPVLLQNESNIYSEFLKDYCVENSKKSGDGATILTFKVLNI